MFYGTSCKHINPCVWHILHTHQSMCVVEHLAHTSIHVCGRTSCTHIDPCVSHILHTHQSMCVAHLAHTSIHVCGLTSCTHIKWSIWVWHILHTHQSMCVCQNIFQTYQSIQQIIITSEHDQPIWQQTGNASNNHSDAYSTQYLKSTAQAAHHWHCAVYIPLLLLPENTHKCLQPSLHTRHGMGTNEKINDSTWQCCLLQRMTSRAVCSFLNNSYLLVASRGQESQACQQERQERPTFTSSLMGELTGRRR